jgi:hypothetical protein
MPFGNLNNHLKNKTKDNQDKSKADEQSKAGYNTGKWSDDDDYSLITPFFGPSR